MLEELARQPGTLDVIFRKAQNRIQDPAKLKRLIGDLIGRENWSAAGVDIKGDADEELLQKGAENTPQAVRVATYALDADQTVFKTPRRDHDCFDIWLNETVRPDKANRDCLVIEEKKPKRAHHHQARRGQLRLRLPTASCEGGDVQGRWRLSREEVRRATAQGPVQGVTHQDGEQHLRRSTPKHEGLIQLLALFGFEDSARHTSRGLASHTNEAANSRLRSIPTDT